MAYQNNIYGNAAFVGFYAGFLAGRPLTDPVAADYNSITAAALAQAVAVDALIAFDALVTTAAAITQLAITTNVIAANEQWRGNLLKQLCYGAAFGRATQSVASAAVQANAIFAAWTSGIAALVTP